MSLGTVLDVVIGLVFTYLLLGIIASGVQEAWVALINKRGKELEKGIGSLLSGSGNFALDDKVFSHSLVFGLTPGDRNPSYVPARNFGLAVVEALRDGGQGPVFSEIEKTVAALPRDSAIRKSLTALITDAKGDLDALKKSIETWFDDAMDRVTGIYKRYTQIFTLLFGLLAAIVFNVDSINLAGTLWSNGPLRDTTLAAAQQYLKDHPAPPTAGSAQPSAGGQSPQSPAGDAQKAQADAEKTRAEAEKAVKDAVAVLDRLPVGWIATDAEKARWAADHTSCGKGAPPAAQTATPASEAPDGCKPPATTMLAWRLTTWPSALWVVLGWLITALATSLGAPFWFDALKNLLQLRNTGPKPKRSDEAATS